MNLLLANKIFSKKRNVSVRNVSRFTHKRKIGLMPVYFFILAILLSFGPIARAQSPCDAVSVEVFGMDPQSGIYSYFGVRVSIPQPYSQDITVSGYIWDGPDDHGYNEDHPYTLTIVAGSLSAETPVTFYQTGPAAEGAANITYVSPCPVWNVDPSNPNNPFDYYGSVHNDILNYVVNNNIGISSYQDVSSAIVTYYQTHGWSYDAAGFFTNSDSLRTSFQNATNICDVIIANGFSNQYCSYYNSIVQLFDASADYNSFHQSMVSLENQINGDNSLVQREKEALLAAASIARYSGYYWNDQSNVNKWETYTGNYSTFHPSQYSNSGFAVSMYAYNLVNWSLPKNMPFRWSWSSLGKADLKGGIEGGVAGAVVGGSVSVGTLTVPSWVAGAVSWGAACSVSNAFGQLTGWW